VDISSNLKQYYELIYVDSYIEVKNVYYRYNVGLVLVKLNHEKV